MFPQPSPNSQALYNQLQSGGATPGTLDFHRTAMNARAQSQANTFTMNQNGATSQPTSDPNIQPGLDSKPFTQGNQSQQQDAQDPFGSHQTNDAANGLYMLAQAGGQQQQQRGAQPAYGMQQQQQGYPQGMPQEASAHQRANKGSIGSTMSGSTENGQGEYSDEAETKPQTRPTRGKKGSTGKVANNKRKQEETPVKGANKKQRGANGSVAQMEEMDDMDEDMDESMMNDEGPDGKKMTDEEKRKNFLERNRYVYTLTSHQLRGILTCDAELLH
jgi:ATF/CREB family transcription factor